MNTTERIAALTAQIAELEAYSFDVDSANTWWLLSNGILCANPMRLRRRGPCRG